MDRKEAIERVLRYNSKLRNAVDKIVAWNENLTLRELCEKFHGHYRSRSTMFAFLKRYRLGYNKIRENLHKRKNFNDLRLSAMRKLRHEHWTYEMIAKCFKCSKQNVEHFLTTNHDKTVGR